jgi:hypothetical protein
MCWSAAVVHSRAAHGLGAVSSTTTLCRAQRFDRPCFHGLVWPNPTANPLPARPGVFQLIQKASDSVHHKWRGTPSGKGIDRKQCRYVPRGYDVEARSHEARECGTLEIGPLGAKPGAIFSRVLTTISPRSTAAISSMTLPKLNRLDAPIDSQGANNGQKEHDDAPSAHGSPQTPAPPSAPGGHW